MKVPIKIHFVLGFLLIHFLLGSCMCCKDCLSHVGQWCKVKCSLSVTVLTAPFSHFQYYQSLHLSEELGEGLAGYILNIILEDNCSFPQL